MPAPPKPQASVRGTVYYCPDLRLYRYETESSKDNEQVDYKFTADELEDALVAILAGNDPHKKAEANFLANMTGLARVNPHKVVSFDTGADKIEVLDAEGYWKKHDLLRDEAEGDLPPEGAGGEVK